MKAVNVFVSQAHYLDHLAPIWFALDESERGRIFAGSSAVLAHALELGLRPVPTVWQSYPWGRRTYLQDHQPYVLVAGWRDQRMSGRARTVFIEHGAGQTYVDDDIVASQPGGPGRGRADLFLCPGRRVVDVNRAAYPEATSVAVGCPKLDPWLAMTMPSIGLARKSHPTVAFTFHWEPRRSCPERATALGWWLDSLPTVVSTLRRIGWTVLGHGHPRAWSDLEPLWEKLEAEPVASFEDVLDRADVLVADNTSAIWEFAAVDRPIVLLNSPSYRRDVEHGLRFWEHADAGINCETGSSGEVIDAITMSFQLDPCRDARRRAVADVYAFTDGKSARRAVAAMRSALP